jgi:hypothetical protein
MSGQVTVELRDASANAIGEITALIWRYGGSVVSVKDAHVTVTALDSSVLATLFAALEADPRVISTAEREAAARSATYVADQAEIEAARKADRETQLAEEIAALKARIAELERQ